MTSIDALPPLAPGTAAPRPAPSPLATALFNLTGLSIGYAVLGRWVRFGAYLAVSAVLVAVALATDAASLPWLWGPVAVLWVGWQAVDGWRCAARDRAGRPSATLPLLLAVASLVVVAAGHVGYGLAGRAEFADARAAQVRADCRAAAAGFATVDGVYELTLSRVVVDARRGADGSRDLDAALAAAGSGRADESITRLRGFRASYPDSVLSPFVAEELAAGLLRRATSSLPRLRTASEPERAALASAAVEDLTALRRETGTTSSAPQVAAALRDTYAAAVAPMTAGRNCEVLPVLDRLTAVSRTDGAEIATRADADRPKALLACGRERYRAADHAGVTAALETLVARYPSDPGVPAARSLLIANRVAAAKTGGPAPGVPAPLGAEPPGTVDVVFYNGTRSEIRVLLAGSTAHEFVQPPCTTCPATPPTADPCANAQGQPPARLRLGPGDFDVLTLSTGSSRPDVQRLTAGAGSVFCYVPTAP